MYKFVFLLIDDFSNNIIYFLPLSSLKPIISNCFFQAKSDLEVTLAGITLFQYGRVSMSQLP